MTLRSGRVNIHARLRTFNQGAGAHAWTIGGGFDQPALSPSSCGKETGTFVLKPRGILRAVLTTLVLIILLAGVSCKLGGGAIDEANQLNQSAGQDINEIDKIIQENKTKEGEITRALNAGQTDAARKMMDETISAIDRGLDKGKSAADKLDRASKLDIDPAIKDYLSYRAQSVSKAIEAFKELRQGIVNFRDATGSTDQAVVAKGRNDVQQVSQNFDALISEAQRLEGKADEIARRNPDKIKPGQ